MAGIILKDGNGNEIEYSGVNQINVTYKDDTNTRVHKFYRLATMRPYIVTQNGSVGNIATYEVTERLQFIPSDDVFACGMSDDQIEAMRNGIMIITAKDLTVGETYLATDMFY